MNWTAIRRYLKHPRSSVASLVARSKYQIANRREIAYWKSLRHIFKGKRGFVIGNGPSLRISDLDRIINEISIASNKIYLAFPSTDWRPNFHTVCDELVWKKISPTLHHHFSTTHTPDYLDPSSCTANVYRWKSLGIAQLSENGSFSDDALRGFFGGASVTFENLQFAAFLGLNPIILIGCDHTYQGECGSRNSEPILATDASNHFVPGYRSPGEVVNSAPIHLMDEAYRCARRWASQNRIEILNATRGGALEIFPRVPLDSII